MDQGTVTEKESQQIETKDTNKEETKTVYASEPSESEAEDNSSVKE